MNQSAVAQELLAVSRLLAEEDEEKDASIIPISKMASPDIDYLGHIQDDETLVTVRFNIKGTTWNYRMDALHLKSVAGVARYSAGRALAYAKKHAIKSFPDRKQGVPEQLSLFARKTAARRLLMVARHLAAADDVKHVSQETLDTIGATIDNLRKLNRSLGQGGWTAKAAGQIGDAFRSLHEAEKLIQQFQHDVQYRLPIQ